MPTATAVMTAGATARPASRQARHGRAVVTMSTTNGHGERVGQVLPISTPTYTERFALCDVDGRGWTEGEIDEQYRQLLDEIGGPVKIGALTYDASVVLAAVDPIAYRCGLADYTSNLIDDGWTEG